MQDWKFYLILILVCLVVQGLFAMVELACVSFNKVRLQYYVSRQQKGAMAHLSDQPSRLSLWDDVDRGEHSAYRRIRVFPPVL